MSNAMRYIKNLEAAGFDRNQAEAQVEMVLDALEGDLATKSDFELFKEQVKNQFVELELRLLTRMGIMIASSSTITIAVLAWLIKV